MPNTPNTPKQPQTNQPEDLSTNAFFCDVYTELYRIAAQKMWLESVENTLSPTALVNEAYVRLRASRERDWDSRGHFFSAAAEAMRRILIDRARGKSTAKRKGTRQLIELDNLNSKTLLAVDMLLDLNDALERLESIDKVAAQFVKLRLFAGLNNIEAGKAIGVSKSSAYRIWDFATAWFATDGNFDSIAH